MWIFYELKENSTNIKLSLRFLRDIINVGTIKKNKSKTFFKNCQKHYLTTTAVSTELWRRQYIQILLTADAFRVSISIKARFDQSLLENKSVVIVIPQIYCLCLWTYIVRIGPLRTKDHDKLIWPYGVLSSSWIREGKYLFLYSVSVSSHAHGRRMDIAVNMIT